MLSDIFIRLRSLLGRARVESELETELRFHMENAVREKIGRGMSPSEARRRVRLEFGGIDQIKEECRRARGVEVVDNLARDLRYGVRKLVHDWRFSLAAILILTLGIGANTAMFSFVNSVALRPLPFAERERLVDIYQDSDAGDPTASSFPAYRDILAHSDVFSGVAAGYPTTVRIENDGGFRVGLAEYATSNTFDVLGVRPSLGRWFNEEEDAPEAGAVAVLTRSAWRTKWGADPQVIGKTIRVNAGPVTIVGVGPEGFHGRYPGVVFDFWLSLSSLAPVSGPYAAGTLDRRQDHWFQVKARLADGAGIGEARAAMDNLARRLAVEFPALNEGRGITVFEAGEVRLHPSADGVVLPAATLLLVVMALVLAIAASNLATLFLVRGTFRAREVAVRLAMGATRPRIVGQLLVESIVLSLAGGLLGLILADRGVSLLAALESAAPVPLTADLSLDHRVLVFALALSLATGVAFGLAPALRSSKTDLTSTLRDGEGALSIRRRWFSLRNSLVVVQVAASCLLLFGAGVFIRSLSEAESADVGFPVDVVAFLQTNAFEAGYDPDGAAGVYDRLVESVRAIPGVEAVGRVNQPPFRGGNTGTNTLIIEGYQAPSGTGGVELTPMAIDPEYFEALAIPIRYGRAFSESDDGDAEPVAVVNETLALRYYGTADAVGRRFRPQTAEAGDWIRIVGVVGDTKVADPTEDTRAVFYRPLGQVPYGVVTVIARTGGDPAVLVEAMRRELGALDRALPVLQAKTMRRQLEDSLEGAATSVMVLGGLGVLALGLAAIGLYAVVAFAVSRRAVEIGIRLALGARRRQVLTLVCGDVLALVGAGLLIGLGASAAVAGALEGFIYGVPPVDPVTLGAVAVLMAAISTLAACLPVRRALAGNPLGALRRD